MFRARPVYASTIRRFQGAELDHAVKVPGAAYTAIRRVRRGQDLLIGGQVTVEHFLPAVMAHSIWTLARVLRVRVLLNARLCSVVPGTPGDANQSLLSLAPLPGPALKLSGPRQACQAFGFRV